MERIRHFELLETIGEGGFACVYRARDTRLGREVALKRLRADLTPLANARRRILQEGRAIAKLSHPGIVALHDVVAHPTGLVLVMELVEGETLARRIARGPLGSRAAIALGCDVAQALAHAHDRGVVHRDLKPSNLLLTEGGGVKVSDFGLARFVTEPSLAESPVSAPDSIVGTPAYMSPEQVRGIPADARSDIFSLCLVLFEAATGRRLFEGASFYEMATAILHAEPDWTAAAAAGLETGLAAVLARGLAKEPGGRYADMRALARDLGSLLAAPAAVAAGDEVPAIVGRRSEIARLRETLVAIAAPGGRGRTVVIAGEAGVGKTTLVEEIVRLHAHAAPLPVARVAFREGNAGFRPIAEATAALLRAARPEGAAALLEKLSEPADARPSTRFPEALDAAFGLLAGSGPFLLVVENLHDAGPDAIDAIRVAASVLPLTRGLLLVTYRPEERLVAGPSSLRAFLAWARGEQLAEEILLPRFRVEQTAELLARMLPRSWKSSERLVDRIQADTEGNALFVCETARLLVERDDVHMEGEEDLAARPIPGRMRDVLARRVAALEPELLRLLEAAAIEGEVFHSGTVAHVLGIPRSQALQAIERLVRDHQIVVPSGREYRFSHAKFREVVSDAILPERRADLHVRIAERLRTEAAPDPGRIARHLVAADRLEAALPFLLPAARKALHEGAAAEAHSLLAAAAEAFAAEGPQAADGPALRDHLDVLLELGRLQQTAGRRDAARETFARAYALGEPDARSRAIALYQLGGLDLVQGRFVEARRHFTRARATFERIGDPTWRAACHDAAGVTYRHEGRLAEALREARAALRQRQRTRFAWGVALSQSNLGAIHFALGDPRRSLACVEASCRYFRRHVQRPEARQRMATALGNIGLVCAALGQVERAIEAHAENLLLKRAAGNRDGEPTCLVNLADAQVTAGLRTAAADAYARAERLADASGDRAVRADALRGLAVLQRTAGAPLRALPLLEESIREASAAHDMEAEAKAALELAQCRAECGKAGAHEALIRAQAAIRKGGLPSLHARAAYVRARLQEREGQRKAALASYRRLLAPPRRNLEPELEWRTLRDLADLIEGAPRGRSEAARLRGRARRIVAGLARAIADPALRRAFESDPERANLLAGRMLAGGSSGHPTGSYRYAAGGGA